MTYFGNLRVNPNPCTEQDQRRNWDIANQLFETIIDQGTVDNYTVCVDTSDTEPAFLNDKLYNQGAYLDGTHQLVYADIYVDAGVRKVRLFTAAAAAAGADNYKVKSSGTDTTDEYLHDAIADAAAGGTYSSGADILVKAETIDAGAGNLRERLFADMSTKTGYSLTVTRVFACVSGNTRFIDLSNFYSELWDTLDYDGIEFVDNTLRVVEPKRLIRGTAVGTVNSGDASFTIDNVETLASGETSASSATVYNIHSYKYVDNEEVEAAWNENDNRWEAMLKAEGYTGFVCSLGADLAKSSPGSLVYGTATVSAIGQNGALVLQGTRAVYNPFTVELPASNAQYTCVRSYRDPTDSANDQFLITGLDVMAVLYHLTGAGAATSLAIPESGSTADDIQWMGTTCDA